MTIFDVLFLAAFLLSLIALIVAAYAAVRGHVPRAFSILRGWLVCAALYLGVSVAVAYAPRSGRSHRASHGASMTGVSR
jgi:hypothetical protein